MALTTDQKSSFLFKQAQGVAETTTSKDYFEEPKKGRAIVFNDEVWVQSGDIPQTAPTLTDGQTSGVVQRFVARSMTAIAGVSSAFYLEELKDSIPFNFGDGTYNYAITNSSGQAIAFGQGDWVVNNAAGTLTFYGTVPSGMPPKISFYKYVGTKGISTGDFIPVTEKGAANGVASLGSDGKVPSSQLPPAAAAPVTSVNGEIGDVVLTTANISENTNLYFTDTRAKNAAVLNDISGSQIDQAPSVSAVKTYITTEIGNEASERASQDTVLDNKINTEISDRTAADALLIPLTQKGQPEGVATLDVSGKIPAAQIPPTAITSVTVVATIAERDALIAQEGDFCVVTDVNETYVYNGAEWIQLEVGSAVSSVNGKTGTVVLSSSDVGAIPTTEKGTANGVATLNALGKLSPDQVPDIASAVTSVNGQTGDVTITPENLGAVKQSGDTMTGVLNMGPTGTTPGSGGQISFSELAANGSGYVSFKAPDSIAANTTWTLPSADGTNGQLLKTDGSGNLSWTSSSSPVTSVNGEIGDVVLTTTDISEGTNQYFTNARAQNSITGAASTITTSNLTASRALSSDASGKVAVSTTTSAELGYLSGVTSAVQTQINSKVAKSGDTMTGALNLGPTGVSAGSGGLLKLSELAANGTNFVALKAPDSIAADTTWTLPSADGTSGQMLTTNGSGTLSWGNATATTGTLVHSGITNTNTYEYGGSSGSLSGLDNTFIGVSSGRQLTSGSYNTLFGSQAANNLSGSSGNTAIGYGALNNTTQGDNTAVGFKAGFNNTAGYQNVYLGSQAGFNYISFSSYNTAINSSGPSSTSNLSGTVAIGTDASGNQARPTADNQFVLGSSNHKYRLPGIVETALVLAPTSTSAGAGGVLRFRELAANGTNFVALRAPDSIAADTTWTLPSTDGTNGQAIVTNGTGTLSWATIPSSASFVQKTGDTMTGALNLGPTGVSEGSGGLLKLSELAANGTNFVALKAPDSIAADTTWTLPSADGTNGQVISTDGSGTLSWASVPSTSNFVQKTGDTMTGALNLGPTGVSAGSGGLLKLSELATNGTNFVALKAPDSIAANTTWTLPSADGSSGQVLSTNGSGTLSWVAAGGSSATVTTKTSSYTLQSSDNGSTIVMNNSDFAVITIPAGLSSGFKCKLIKSGLGRVMIYSPSTIKSATGTIMSYYSGVVNIDGYSSETYNVTGDTTNFEIFAGLGGFYTNGQILSQAISGSNLYIGGIFTAVGNYSDLKISRGAFISKTNASYKTNVNFSLFNGVVYSSLIVGNYIYVGGSFTNYNNFPCQRIVKISILTGQIDQTFDSASGFDNTINSIAVDSSGNIYCGGLFTTYKGTTRQRIAKLNGTTGALDTTFDSASGFDTDVNTIVTDNLGGIYAGGSFTAYKGTTRQRIAKLNSTTGALDTGFDSLSGFNNTVNSLAIDSSGNIYAGGNFTTYKGTTRQFIAKVNGTTATFDTTFDSASGFSNTVKSIVLDSGSNNVYCGGTFTSYKGTARQRIAKINSNTAALDATFNSSSGFPTDVNSIAIDSSGNIYAGGIFTAYKGTTRQYIAKLNGSTAALDTTFDAASGFNNLIYTIALDSSDNLFCGGVFTSYKNVNNIYSRQYIAKINLATNKVDTLFDTASGFNNTVNSIVSDSSGNIYAGGSFSTYKGTTRQYIAKLNGTTAALDATFDSTSGFQSFVNSLAIDSSGNIYAGGVFTQYKGTARLRVAKLNGSTAAIDATFDSSTGFDTDVNSIILDSSGNVYCGGLFNSYKGTTRLYVAKLNGFTAALDTTFDSSTGFNNAVTYMVLDQSNNIYCCGAFTSYSGTTRQYIAKISSTNAALDTTFDTSSGFNSTVRSIFIDGSGNIYAGGNFTAYKGTTRQYIAKVNGLTADIDTTFDTSSGFDNYVFSIISDSSGYIYVGGVYQSFRSEFMPYFAKLNSKYGILST